MITDDLYNLWKRRRSQVEFDGPFADRVMARIRGRGLFQRNRSAVVAESGPARFAWRVQVAAAVFVVGLGLGIIRASTMIAFLLLSTSKGY